MSDNNQTHDYIIIEAIEPLTSRPSQKVLACRIQATDFTDALLKFKALRNRDRLPYETMIIDAEKINEYPKGI